MNNLEGGESWHQMVVGDVMEEMLYSEDVKQESVACTLIVFLSEWKKYRFKIFGNGLFIFEAPALIC
ncbi:hypothetical protein [Nitrospira sp. Ecomares 2.1]